MKQDSWVSSILIWRHRSPRLYWEGFVMMAMTKRMLTTMIVTEMTRVTMKSKMKHPTRLQWKWCSVERTLTQQSINFSNLLACKSVRLVCFQLRASSKINCQGTTSSWQRWFVSKSMSCTSYIKTGQLKRWSLTSRGRSSSLSCQSRLSLWVSLWQSNTFYPVC